MKSPKTDCEALLNDALPFAELMLAEQGEFLPYAHAMYESGKFIAIGVPDGREDPPSRDLIQILKQHLRTAATLGEYRATALVYDVRITLPASGTVSDAIAVSLNHKENYAALVFVPYHLQGRTVIMGESLAQQEENYAFAELQ